ncbi:hypothetical protein JCM17846_09220 [Iodidimonas nitroreducens]|uniref:Uncharacterized protein n=1 Tax=Iodidimonas nitroreducens TaxID=1236968 RepID=A0A5A7N791_9PROT|nr:tetratricopeptide repeat protein [Iodidimonas nitroreducens]GER03240.1 hypothetical protein JCM17846_09220 [Iodidimonas nitroreducens]
MSFMRTKGLILATVLLSGCSVAQEQEGFNFASAPLGEVDFGSYVAGRFAHQTGDPRAADYLLRAADQDPGNSMILSRAFITLLTDGRFDQAAVVARRLYARDSDNSLATLFLALDSLKSGRYKQAQSYIDSLRTGGFEMLVAPIAAAWIHAALGQRDAALIALRPLDQMAALKPFAAAHRAYLLDYLKQDDAARAAYLAALEGTQMASLQPVVSYAAFLQGRGEGDKAVSVIDEYLKAFTDNAFLLKARDQLREGKTPDRLTATPAGAVSLVMFRAAGELDRDDAHRPAIVYARLASFLSPDMDDAHLRLANMLVEAELTDLALKELNKINKKASVYENAQLQAAWIHHQAGDLEKAVDLLQTYLAMRPESAQAWATLGDIYRSNEKFEPAVAAYTKAIHLNTNDPDVAPWFLYFTRGIGYERTDQFDKAEADFLKSLELNPDQAQVLNYLGYSWIDRGMNLEQGTEMIEKAVAQRPNDGFIIDSLGWAYYLRGDYKQAVRHLERAVILEPSDPTLNDHLGDAYWKVGRRTEARFQWNHALASDPEADQRALIEKKLQIGLELAQKEHEKDVAAAQTDNAGTVAMTSPSLGPKTSDQQRPDGK